MTDDARIVGNRPALIDGDHEAPLTVAVHADAAKEAVGGDVAVEVGAAVLAALESRRWGYAIEGVESVERDGSELFLETTVTAAT